MSSPKKRGEGTSCHHCKKRIRPNEMLKCTRGEVVPTNSRKRKRPCVKKYCLHCIKTFYSNQYLDDNSSGSFICPACPRAACRRRVMKARLKTDGSALENEADGEANSILESQTPDATNIEEGQVNGLLEILDSRPDVQDIIRRGMAMDFADDNAKILYVGHLIDQALTRPDVLALYYASSHGRANNCRIKTEGVSDSVHADLPPETSVGPSFDMEGHASLHTIDGTNHRQKKKRGKIDGDEYGLYEEDDVDMHRKQRKGNKMESEMTVKKEPNNESVNGENDENGNGNENEYNNMELLSINRITAPQPATISLSAMNSMGFTPHTLPNNVSLMNLMFDPNESQKIENGNGKEKNEGDGDTKNENGIEQKHETNIFALPVSPSVVVGGPSLASM